MVAIRKYFPIHCWIDLDSLIASDGIQTQTKTKWGGEREHLLAQGPTGSQHT